MSLVGQERLKEQLTNLRISDQFPRFLLISGAIGSGKRSLVQWLLGFSKQQIITDQKVDSIREVIEITYTLSEPTFFIFPDAQNMTAQAQNAFLKSLEEPAQNAYIIMTVNNVSNVLKTIKSRAHVVNMDGYSKDELSVFTNEKTLLNICSTPGQIERYLSIDWLALVEHCEKVVTNIERISIGNVFSILKHVSKENYDLLIPTMEYIYMQKLRAVRGSSLKGVLAQINVLKETSILLNYSATVNTQNALETMFLKLWEVSRA